MEVDLAEYLISKFSSNEIEQCIEYTTRLIGQVHSGYGLSEPYYLFLDNDVLNALRNPNDYPVRYVALIVFFKALKAHPSTFNIAISPAVFFEYCQKDVVTSEDKLKLGWYQIGRAIKPLDADFYSIGLGCLEKAKRTYDAIEKDKKLILSLLNEVKKSDWVVNLETKNGVKFPHAVANEFLAKFKFKLEYFDDFFTYKYFESVIVSKILHNKKNSSYIRKTMRDPYAIKRAKLLVENKDKLKGSGDLSLLSLCDISSQFKFSSNDTNIALTFDKRLESTLREQSIKIASTSLTIGGQNGDTESSKQKKQEKYLKECERIEQASEAANRFFAEMISLLGEIQWFNKALTGNNR